MWERRFFLCNGGKRKKEEPRRPPRNGKGDLPNMFASAKKGEREDDPVVYFY